jgi:hypothetical protein
MKTTTRRRFDAAWEGEIRAHALHAGASDAVPPKDKARKKALRFI